VTDDIVIAEWPLMRIITQRIDKTTEVCPRLGLIFGGTILFAGSQLVRFVFPNSPCHRGGLNPHDVILHINRIPLDGIHRLEFSDRRRSELDFEIWRSFRRYRMSVHVEPEPFAPIGEIIELARAFVAQCPQQPITFRNPDFDEFYALLGRFGRRGRTRTGRASRGRP
jgi:hypothetical protein